jgi:hypothetical protein
MTTTNTNFDFTDLDDFDNVKTTDEPETQSVEESIREWGEKGSASSQGAIYEEKCEACRGFGRFVSWAGRDCGPCFKCKGKGKLYFKTSPESREAATKSRANKKAQVAAKKANELGAWIEDHKAEVEFLGKNSSWSDFYRSLNESMIKYGSLTEKQLAAVRRGMEKQRERDEAKKAELPATGLDLSDLPSGYYAVPNGETRLKVRVSCPGKQSSWHGWIFVDDGAEYGNRNRYGRQGPGKLYTGKIMEQLEAIKADPHAASVAYGQLTGQCGVCNRKLEDETSVARGIGPVCASRLGWD